ncbi:Transcriptional activator FOSB/c-Fos and related bZIP transcription factors [Ceraceosorus bombacis]|uniref:Transcriptional activator FOSB/c-Fos and related bZIP transcription factors n=1 Tax=Ceraceosorus bombacis TaxID=401625 RepID=A0A0P1BQ59_9BASI|nr:Transcriptional activator FOSB/c-Fos and related bZIP transcription factors [Ceraceosorus bombacis]
MSATAARTAAAGTLRTGPLSPAMLAGPAAASGNGQNNGSGFDVSAYRTGFTPDLSNFKTGLTPLGSGGAGFPPPSPGTAAFLAMITHGGGPGLTPGTLNALTGANGMQDNGHLGAQQSGREGGGKKAKTPHSEAGSLGSPGPGSDDEMEEFDKNGEPLDDEEKRKNFLERNRQAALKCRQRKKAWLQQLQQRAEMLQNDNEHLRDNIGALRGEIAFLKAQLMAAQAQLAGGLPPGSMGEAGGPVHSIPGPHGVIPVSAAQGGGLPPGVPLPSGLSMNMNTSAHPAHIAGVGPGTYQAHTVPRPTHIPGPYMPQGPAGAVQPPRPKQEAV